MEARSAPAHGNCSRQRGVTLIEVLAVIFITGTGMMAQLTLFPLGALSIEKAVRDDRAGNHMPAVVSALHGYFDRKLRFPGSLAEFLTVAGYPETGVRDGYKIALLQLDPDVVVLANEPGVPGVHGWRTAMVRVARRSGQAYSEISFVSAPGAEQGVTRWNDALLTDVAATISSLAQLLSAAERATLHEHLFLYSRQTPEDVTTRALAGTDGKVTLQSIRTYLSTHPEPAIRKPLSQLWERLASKLQVSEFGSSWWVPPDSTTTKTRLFSFSALARLTEIAVAEATLRQELLAKVQQAESAASSGLAAEKQSALNTYVGILQRHIGTGVTALSGNAMTLIAKTLAL